MEEDIKIEKVDLITLLRTFKKEGLDNFIVIRKHKFESQFIPKSKIKEKVDYIKSSKYNYTFERITSEDIRRTIITNLQELMEDK